MKVKVINTSANDLPEYKTVGSAGMDIRASLTESYTLKPMERTLVPTGLHIELPQGYEAQIRPRSGLAVKNGITCLNTPGTIDSDYRGEIKVCLINLANEAFEIKPGDRIAQMIVASHAKIEWEIATDLDKTVRGPKGFGHTGV